MNNTRTHFIWIDWLALIIFNIYLLLAYTSSSRFNLLLSRSGMFTSVILIIIFLNHINLIQALKNKEKELFFCIITGILSFINMIFAKSGPGVLFDIANIILILYLSDKIELDTISLSIIFTTFFLILIFWFNANGEGYNPNTVSLIVLESAMLSALSLSSLLSKWKKDWIIYLYLAVSSALFVYPVAKKFEGRTEIGALFILLFTFLFIPKLVWQFKKLYCCILGIIALICMLVPAMFTHIYYDYINNEIEIPSKFRIFHGREPVWMQYFSAWKKEPLTGIGNNFIEKIPDLRFSSAHNGFLHLLVVYGIIIFFIVLFYFGYKIIQIKTEQISLTKKIGFSIIIAMLAIASMESYLITSFSNMLLFFVFLIIFKENKQIEEQNLEQK